MLNDVDHLVPFCWNVPLRAALSRLWDKRLQLSRIDMLLFCFLWRDSHLKTFLCVILLFSFLIFIIFHSARHDSNSRTKAKIQESDLVLSLPGVSLFLSLSTPCLSFRRTQTFRKPEQKSVSSFLASAFLTQVSAWRLLFSQRKIS